jgi:hypothetical protein
MKNIFAQLSLLALGLSLNVSYAADRDGDSATVVIEAFSGRQNPVLVVDMNDASKLAEAIRVLAYEARTNALTPEGDAVKLSKAIHGYGGIVITDPSGKLMDADASIVIKDDTIITVRNETRTVYANTHPQLSKLIIKYAYKQGAIDRRAAIHLSGEQSQNQ